MKASSIAATLFVLAVQCAAASFAIAADAQSVPRIVNGLETQAFPTTGALLWSGGVAIQANNASTQCTGTLVGCRTFLTAAHCVVDDPTASHYWVYLQHGGLQAVSSITVHPSYDALYSGRDVAIVKLASNVTGIDPTTINSTHNLNSLGTGLSGTIAGFGRTGAGTLYGVKRYGQVTTADCDTSVTNGEGNNVLVCWDYDASVGAPGTDSNTCNGDSGGPLFMDFGGEQQIVGVTSAGTATNCGPGDHSWDASVYYNASWIAGQIGTDSTAACGGLPAVGDATVATTESHGSLGSGASSSFDVVVTGSPQVLRLTLNGTDNGSFNPDFYVKQGSGAGPGSYDCKSDGTSVYGACEFSNPAAGTWSVLVRAASGSGTWQVTTSVFGGDPPVCGDNAKAASEQCDGTDDAACPGACLPDCTCPAPVCGDNATAGSEECDGTDDAACPGACLGNCTCPAPVCSTGPLYFTLLLPDVVRFAYKAQLADDDSSLANLDPRDAPFDLSITDGSASVNLSVPAADAGWIKADPVKKKYDWKGDGSNGGLTRIKMQYKGKSSPAWWSIDIKGKGVPGAGDLNLQQTINFQLNVDGTCHLESW